MFRFDNEIVQPKNPSLPSFKIMKVDMEMEGRGYAQNLSQNASIVLKFDSDEDAHSMMRTMDSGHESEIGEVDGNTIIIKGEDVEIAARFLVKFAKQHEYTLPTDALCKFAAYFENYTDDKFPELNKLVQDRLYRVFAQNSTFNELNDKLSKSLLKTGTSEVKKTIEGLSSTDNIEDQEIDSDISDWVAASTFEEEEEEEEKEQQYGWGREQVVVDRPFEEPSEELSDEVMLINQLEEANRHNAEAYQTLKEHCVRLEKTIADRNKITSAIRSVLRKFLLIKGYDGDKIIKRDVERLKTETAALSTPSVPRDRLDRSETVDELSEKVVKLIAREAKSRTVEEHARDLLRGVARVFTSAYKRAVSETSKDTQQIVRGIVPEQRRSSIFSSNRVESSNSSETHATKQPRLGKQSR